MIVIVIEGIPNDLRGELTRWLLEVKKGVYVGNASALVREKLWEKVKDDGLDALLLYSFNNEQGFKIEMVGNPKRAVVDYDGIQLINSM